MTESLPRIQRHITTATGMPTRLNRPGVAPVDSAEGRAGIESVVDTRSGGGADSDHRTRSASQHGGRSDGLRARRPPSAAREASEHYPHHYVFLEQALMAREMERC